MSHLDDTTIIKNIELKALGEKQTTDGKKKSKDEDYQVVAIEDQRQDAGLSNNFSLFNMDDLKMADSSRKTSASTTVIQGGSLSTILQQALVSDDKDQLDWIFKQKDLSIIDKTLY